ncbi:MAG: hypothetical protein HYX89_06880 [Chloroflexi bacterium]|nr:hypothetical protein [Chloroflexota bacterium]
MGRWLVGWLKLSWLTARAKQGRPARPFPENSLALRLVVLAAVLWAIAALAYAASLYVPGLLAAAGIIAGHRYSWRNRSREFRVHHILLFVALHVVILWTLADLTTGFAGGYFPQAQLVIYVQAVASFDLRTRRGLYGTLIHSLLVFYIAATLGFDLLFALFALGFVVSAALAIVVVYLVDERREAESPGIGLLLRTPALWAMTAPAAIAGGVLLLLLLPWPIGQQLVSPMTVNLPYLGSAAAATITPIFPFLDVSGGTVGFTPEMNLRSRSWPTNVVVMYVRSPVISYWRGLTFDQYTGSEWRSTVAPAPLPFSPAGRYPLPYSAAGASDQRYSQTYYIVRPQPNVIFTGYRAVRLYFPRELVYATGEDVGTFQTQQALPAGTSYVADSIVPIVDPEALRADAIPPNIDKRYLQLPVVSERVRSLALAITQGRTTAYEKAKAIEDYLTTNYGYDLDIPPLRPGQEVSDVLLFQDRRGFCQQFATTMVVLLRITGIPARVVTGYAPGAYNPITGLFAVRARDAHSWVEVPFDRYGWVPFNPTPSVAVGVGQVANAWLSRSVAGRLWEAGALPLVQTGIATAGLLIAGALAFLTLPGSLLLMVPLLLLAFAAIFVMLQHLRPRHRRLTALVEGDNLGARQAMILMYLEMTEFLARHRLPRRRLSQTPFEYAQSLPLEWGREHMEWLTETTVAAAYDPRPFDPKAVRRGQEQLRALKAVVKIRR